MNRPSALIIGAGIGSSPLNQLGLIHDPSVANHMPPWRMVAKGFQHMGRLKDDQVSGGADLETKVPQADCPGMMDQGASLPAALDGRSAPVPAREHPAGW